MRICFFGDSFVNGTGDDTCLGWVGRACAWQRQAGHDLTAYNMGIRGDSSADIAARWFAEATARRASHLVFSFGANDCVCLAGQPRLSLARSLELAEGILQQACGMAPTLMLGPLPVGCAPDDEPANQAVRQLEAGLAPLCHRLGIPWLPLRPMVEEVEAHRLLWQREVSAGDGSHPNHGGYEMLAGQIAGWAGWQGWFAPAGPGFAGSGPAGAGGVC